MKIATKVLDSLKSYGYVPSRMYLVLRSLEETPDDMSVSRQLSLMWSGYVPRDVVRYNLERYDLEDYLSVLEKEKLAFEINSEDAELLDDKRLFLHKIQSSGVNVQVPDVYEAGEVESILQSQDVIVKPTDGKCGVGVQVVSSPQDLTEYDLLSTDLMFMEKLAPPKWLPTYGEGLGTLRLFTLDGEVTGAIVRIPTSDSYPVDNWSNGGVIAGVNLETGVIEKAYKSVDGEIVKTIKHPNTDTQITERIVPNFNQAVKAVEQLCGEFESARVIGWDVVSYEDDLKILEANRNPNLEMMQLFRPAKLMSNEENRV